MELRDSYKIMQDMVLMLVNSPDGITNKEFVAKLNVSREAIQKYIRILEYAGIPIYMDGWKYYIDEGFQRNFTLTADESEFLYLILERSITLHHDRWHTLRSLLNKLSLKMAKPLADYLDMSIDIDAPINPGDRHFRLLAQAKREQRVVQIEYHALNRESSRVWTVHPLRFTTNVLSDGVYLVGQALSFDNSYRLMTFKLDRIYEVWFTKEKFDSVSQARFADIQHNAWGVWNSEKSLQQVVLQFELRHYDRLLETVWHDTQEIRVDNNNNVIFSVEVAEPDEMVPWIRSWGSGVIVLEPESLRQRIMNSLYRQMKAYGFDITAETDGSPEQFLWAKYERSTGDYHLLMYHLIDVGGVALQMWDQVLSRSQKHWLAYHLQVGENVARNFIAFLTALHDIGKATPSFQRKAKPLFDHLCENSSLKNDNYDIAHGILSAVIIKKLLSSGSLAKAIGGHHGSWITDADVRQARSALGGSGWSELQQELIERLKTVFVVNLNQIYLPDDERTLNVLSVILSGFVSVCDWIGSNEQYFPYESRPIDDERYLRIALKQADTALHNLGWTNWQTAPYPVNFTDMFPFNPNAMQHTIIDTLKFGEHAPRLILIEYLTGGGKTEIALYLADMLNTVFAQNGVFVAMPTQATSNQMYSRVKEFLKTRYPDRLLNLQLIHSQATMNRDYQSTYMQPGREGNESGVIAEQWFTRKRALLAPYGVGTVDQAMMSVMHYQHHFVRQFALSNKTILFDEIHAYDTYMNQIIERMLMWLDALNSTMILLSATLSHKNRQDLLQQVGARVDAMPDVPYPRLTVVDHDRSVRVIPLPLEQTRRLNLYILNSDNWLEWLADIYNYGGNIAIVCNTVNQAIEITRMLQDSHYFEVNDILLFHARTIPQWRQRNESKVLELFGKDSNNRPRQKILVATQIIEQSLDLDFDLMVTFTAPIDLLIQRAGRVHRHQRERPQHLIAPTLVIFAPSFDAQGVPDFGVDEVIYERYLLLRTWQIIADRDDIKIPGEIDTLMEFVYPDEANAFTAADGAYRSALEEAFKEMFQGERRQSFRGHAMRLRKPDDEDLIGNADVNFRDEGIELGTRDMRPSVDLICVSEQANPLNLPILLDRKPTGEEVSHLLQFKVTLSQPDIVRHFSNLDVYSYWRHTPALKYAHPLVFDQDTLSIPNTSITLRISPYYGIEIIKETE